MKGNRKKENEKLLSHYFEIKGNTATVDLFYDSFEDIINQNFGKDDVNMIDSRLYQDIASAFKLLPTKYNVNIRLNIRDFGKFSIQEAKTIIESNLQLRTHSIILTKSRMARVNFFTLAVGAAILIASYALSHRNYPAIVYDVVNIAGTLCIWETISSMFLEGNYERNEAARLAAKLKRFIICCPGEKDAVDCEINILRLRKKNKY